MRLVYKINKSFLIKSILFGLVAAIELVLVNEISDLRPWLSTWAPKAHEILSLNPPSDNYYGPGAAILLIPFLWNAPLYFIANIFYIFVGALAYFNLCQRIRNLKFRIISYCSLLLNPYFFWLCHSSQDTVMEFALLMIAINFWFKHKFILFFLTTFLLSEVRSQYWLFIFTALLLRVYLDIKSKQRLKKSYFLPIIFLVLVSTFNLVNYGTPSLTWFLGETFELGQSKYMYLAQPKFDADHLLGLADNSNTYRESRAPDFMTPGEKNNFYLKQGLDSIIKNPKQFILNLMQKTDSFIFSSQKIPSSPGYFTFDKDSKSIKIIDERLNWNIILGHLSYQIWRIFAFIVFIASITLYMTDRTNERRKLLDSNEHLLLLPWFCSFLTVLLLYMETRYKVIPELLLPIYSFYILDRIHKCSS